MPAEIPRVGSVGTHQVDLEVSVPFTDEGNLTGGQPSGPKPTYIGADGLQHPMIWKPGVGWVVGPDYAPAKRLAAGGIVTAPTLAMMGEGRRREAVIPLQTRAGRAALAGVGRGNTYVFQFPNYLGDKRDLETEIRRALARTGRANGNALGGLA